MVRVVRASGLAGIKAGSVTSNPVSRSHFSLPEMKQKLARIWNSELWPYFSNKLALFHIDNQKYVFLALNNHFFSLPTGKSSNIFVNSLGGRKLKIKFCTYNEHLFLLISIILLKSEFQNSANISGFRAAGTWTKRGFNIPTAPGQENQKSKFVCKWQCE